MHPCVVSRSIEKGTSVLRVRQEALRNPRGFWQATKQENGVFGICLCNISVKP
jgi:hypothetical protein